MKNFYLPSVALGKTYFRRKSSLPVLEIPIGSFTSFSQEILKYFPKVSNSENLERNIEFFESFFYRMYVERALLNFPNLILLGAALRNFYTIAKNSFNNFNIITLVPERVLEEEFYGRIEERHVKQPGDILDRSFFHRNWEEQHDFFEEAAKTDPNIIFTKPGEYLTDYLDLETGEFKKPELLSF